MDKNAFGRPVGSATQAKPAPTLGGDDDEMASTKPVAAVHGRDGVDRGSGRQCEHQRCGPAPQRHEPQHDQIPARPHGVEVADGCVTNTILYTSFIISNFLTNFNPFFIFKL